MTWRNVRLILLREVRDQSRDRRTLFMIAILPLLLYPGLGIGMVQMTVLFSEQPRTVVVLGAEHLPSDPPLLQGDGINPAWFEDESDARTLAVVTDLPRSPNGDDAEDPADSGRDQAAARAAALLAEARPMRAPVRERQAIRENISRAEKSLSELEDRRAAAEQARRAAAEQDAEATRVHEGEVERIKREMAELSGRIQGWKKDLDPIEEKISELFAKTGIQVLIVVPDGFQQKIAHVNEKLKRRTLDAADEEDYYSGPTSIANRADEKSLIAYTRVKKAIERWERRILEQRLSYADLPSTVAMPVNADPIDVARKEQLSANVWSKLFPALLIIMAVTGAFYPAVDLAAGEKERGTMETLLICPASRTEIVVGKFLTVMLFSMSTALLNLLSMGLTGKYMASMAGGGAISRMGDLTFPGFGSLAWVIVLLIPLAALFSALCLALATFARSSKEGQYYLTPLLMVTLGLTVFCLSPGIEITPFYSIMPIVGPALLLRELLAPSGGSQPLIYAIPVLATSIGYSLLALWWAIDQFAREDVLFREAERFELGLWIRHLLRDKDPVPSFTEAGFCFVLIMLLQFAAFKILHAATVAGVDMLRLMMIQQLVIIATPALLMGVMLTTSPRRTFRLRMPSLGMLAIAAALPFVLHPLSFELQASLSWFFPPLPAEIARTLKLATGNASLWLVLLAFAVAPAICEEVAFRGFILSGFHSTRRTWLALALSSLTFGVMHMIPQQVFNASLLGLVLGLIALRSGSLVPAILFHFLFNALAVLHGRVGAEGAALPDWLQEGPATWFVRLSHQTVRYQWPTLVLAALAAIVLLRILVKPGTRADEAPAPPVPPAGASDARRTAGKPPVAVG
ncbi:MAG: ABC transporter permease subunit/CPBP intramembrane protease [Planctomycetales bacterium]